MSFRAVVAAVLPPRPGGASVSLGQILGGLARAGAELCVVAPITAVCAVVIPLIAGLLFGEHLTPLAALGVAMAIAAVVLLGQDASSADDTGVPRTAKS